MTSNTQSTETTVVLTATVVLPGTAEPTDVVTFASTGGHHVDKDRTLFVKGTGDSPGNLATFKAEEYRFAYSGNVAPAAGSDA